MCSFDVVLASPSITLLCVGEGCIPSGFLDTD